MDSVLLTDELKQILSDDIKDALLTIFNAYVPHYFTEVGTSPTRRHHPNDEYEPGGLVLHTKRVFWVAVDLCRVFQLFGEDRDEILAAALVHDIFCRGLSDEPEEYTIPDHELFVEYVFEGFLDTPGYRFLTICKAHAGRWGPAPITTLQQLILHLADYIASRPHIFVDVMKAQE